MNPVATGNPVTYEILQTYPGSSKPFADFSYDPVTRKLYSVKSRSSTLYSIDLTDPSYALETLELTGPALQEASGATWFNALGDLFVFDNIGVIMKVDIAAETIEVFGDGIGATSRNDGASCVFRPGLSKSVDAPTHFPGERLTYTFELGNPTAVDFTEMSLVDTLTYEAQWVEGSLKVDAGCTGSFVAATDILGQEPLITAGGRTLQVLDLSVASADSLCFSMQAEISIDAPAGPVENQATLTGLPAVFGSSLLSDDPNSVEDTDPTTHEVLPGVRVGDFVFRDVDGDGEYEAGDSPIGGVVVSLHDAGGDLVATTVSAADVAYGFDAVRPGSYTV